MNTITLGREPATEKCLTDTCQKQVPALSLLARTIANAVPDAQKHNELAHSSVEEVVQLRAIITVLGKQLPELAAQVTGYHSHECRRRKVPAR
jgi:hypothetical protein